MNNINPLIRLRDKKKKPLLLDGAMGSLLISRGYKPDENLWTSLLNIENPKKVLEIHKEYISAGADIITTNTFRTNPAVKKKSNLSVTNTEFVRKSVELAKTAKGNSEIIIAGSNAPAEDCYQKERTLSRFEIEFNHKKHIEMLWEAGVDIIWNETQSHLDEIEIICQFCSENSIPFAMNLYFTEELNLLSGEPVTEAIDIMKSYSTNIAGFNCISGYSLKLLLKTVSLPNRYGFYLNCGLGNVHDNKIACSISPEEYVTEITEYFADDLFFIGSCCGSTPEHTKELRKCIDEVYRD